MQDESLNNFFVKQSPPNCSYCFYPSSFPFNSYTAIWRTNRITSFLCSKLSNGLFSHSEENPASSLYNLAGSASLGSCGLPYSHLLPLSHSHPASILVLGHSRVTPTAESSFSILPLQTKHFLPISEWLILSFHSVSAWMWPSHRGLFQPPHVKGCSLSPGIFYLQVCTDIWHLLYDNVFVFPSLPHWKGSSMETSFCLIYHYVPSALYSA